MNNFQMKMKNILQGGFDDEESDWGAQTNGSEHVSAKTSVNEEFPNENEKDSAM